MVTGRPWNRDAPRSEHALRPLDATRRAAILDEFRARYPLEA
jgi:hypothetical protein